MILLGMYYANENKLINMKKDKSQPATVKSQPKNNRNFLKRTKTHYLFVTSYDKKLLYRTT